MRKGLCTLITALTAGALFMSSNLQAQANSSPYWSTEGNSNADNASKLGTTNAIPLRLFTNDQLRAYISSAGNFGIGTASPQQRLHVEGTSNQALFVNTSAVGPLSGSGQIGYAKGTPTAAGHRLGYFLVGSRGGAQFNYNTAGMAGYASAAWTAGSSHPTYLTFETTPSGATSRVERIRIESGGDVGIGTTNPINKLHVVGRGRFTDGLTVSESGIYSNNTNGDGIEAIGNSSSGAGVRGNGYYGVYGSGGSYGVFGSGSSFGTYGSGFYGTYGVSSSSSGYGVVGAGGAYGTYGSGSSYGLYAYSSGGTGIYAQSNGTSSSSPAGYAGQFVSNNYRGIIVTSASTWYAGYFNGDVFTTGSYVGSDARLKKNIKDVDNAMDIISKLQPKHYEFRNDGNYGKLNLPKGDQFGLIAQDLEKILPSLVREANVNTKHISPVTSKGVKDGKMMETAEDPKGEDIEFKAVNYTGLIPIMVKAMQEQEQKIGTLTNEVAELKAMVNKLASGGNVSANLNNASLGTANPNPVNGSTLISYNVPDGSKAAHLLVTDMKGSIVKQITLGSRGNGRITLNTGALAAGTYTYSLHVDGAKVASKQLLIAR